MLCAKAVNTSSKTFFLISAHFKISFILTLKAPITTAADDIHKYFFIVFFEKIKLDVSSKSSARQRILLKNQALFSSKDKSKELKCCLPL